MLDLDKKFLIEAHLLAKKQFGKTFPNPTVGCIIVKNGKVVSKAVTASAGRPHAEEIAIKKAKDKTENSTMYVTLEPCFHKSSNGSCAEQIINAGIKKIFIAREDPDIRTNGKSILEFKKNKIKTIVGKTSLLTSNLNNFFFKSLINKRPYTKVKMAISKDKKIAWPDYSSKWISNSVSRKYSHKIRFQSQAILTTSKTILKDNPRFTVRNNNKITKYLPIIVIDKSLRIPLNCKLIKNLTKTRLIIFTSQNNKKFNKLKSLGCEIYLIKKINTNGEFNLNLIMKKIFSLNIYDILVEAGGNFFTKLLINNLVDEIHLFEAPFKIGKLGKPMIINKTIDDFYFKKITKKKFGKDIYHHFLTNK